ncbi:MAG: prepilin peptidase [Candidatus Riflebacteria bacterium]|nr:prepilin peptidase [Candidatus Riflebacteria bacterium]
MAFTLIAFGLGLVVGSFCTTAIERLPLDDEFHYQLFAGEEDLEPPEWWMRIPFIWLFVKPPEGQLPHWYDRLPLLPYFLYAWKFSNFRKLLPPAHCPSCGHRLPWRERLPVVSFFALGGRCSSCRIKIPGRHVFVELATGLLFALFAHRFGPSWLFAAWAFVIATFVIGSVIDWRYQIIPDEVNSMGLVIGVLYCAVTWLGWSLGVASDRRLLDRLGGDYPYLYSSFGPESCALGFLVGAGSLYLFAEIGGMLARTDAMGGGDVKLAAYIGLFIGPAGILTTLFYSALIAAPCGILVLLLGAGKKERGFTKFAFGPYIAMGALLVMYYGHTRLVNAYLAINQAAWLWLTGW